MKRYQIITTDLMVIVMMASSLNDAIAQLPEDIKPMYITQIHE